AVVVQAGRAVDNLHAAVAVHIGGRDAVVALAGQQPVGGVGADLGMGAGNVEGVGHRHKAGIDAPNLVEVPGKEIVGDDGRAGVVAAADNQVGPLAFEVGNAGIEPVHPVAGFNAGPGVVAPGKAVVHPAKLEGDRFPLGAGAVEHRQVLGAFVDKALKL